MKPHFFLCVAFLFAALVSLRGFPMEKFKAETPPQEQTLQRLRQAAEPQDSSPQTTSEATTATPPHSKSAEWPSGLEAAMDQLVDSFLSSSPLAPQGQTSDWWGEIIQQEQGHYDHVDELISQHQKNWNSWIMAERRLKLEQEAQQQALEKLQQEEAALAAIDLSKTKTGQFIEGCNDLTSVLQYAPALSNFNPLALSTQGAAVVAKYIQQGMIQVPKKAAEKAFRTATERTLAAQKEVLEARNATLQENHAQAEKEARAAEAHSIMEAARRLKIASADSFWNDPSLATFSLDQFSPSWKEERGLMLWQKRKDFHVADQAGLLDPLEPFKKSYQEAEEKVIEANKKTKSAREKLEFLTQLKTELEGVFENAINQFGSLATQTSLESAHALTDIQKEIRDISSDEAEVKKHVRAAQRAFEEARRLGNVVETRASKLYKTYRSKVASADKKNHRATVRIEAYQAALNKFWQKEISGISSEVDQTQLQYQQEELPDSPPLIAAKIAFSNLEKESLPFLESLKIFSADQPDDTVSFETITQIAAAAVSKLKNVAAIVKPASKELAETLRLTAKMLDYFGTTSSTTPGRALKIKDHLTNVQKAADKITATLWKGEKDWTVAMAQNIAQVARLHQEASTKNSRNREIPRSAKSIGSLFAKGSPFQSFLESSDQGIHLHLHGVEYPALTKEKKELEELRKSLVQRKNRLRQQAEQQARRLAIERAKLAEERRAAITQIMAVSEEQAKALEARERQLTVERAEKAAADLKILEENLKRDHELFQQEQQKKLRIVITSFEERIKILETQEQELATSQKEQEDFVEKISREMEQQHQAAQEKIRIAEIKRSRAEEESMRFAEQAQAEKEALQQKLTATTMLTKSLTLFPFQKTSEEVETTFEEAKRLKTEAGWKKAATAAQQIEREWQLVLDKNEYLLTTAPQAEQEILEEILKTVASQQEYWQLQAALADSEARVIQVSKVSKASPPDKTAIAKVTFVKAKATWAFFSRAIKIFQENRTEGNLKIASDAAAIAADAAYTAANAVHAVNIARAADVAGYAARAAFAARTVVNAADATARTEANRATARAAADATARADTRAGARAGARAYAAHITSSQFEEEARWAATAAQEAADFAKAVVEFRAEQEGR